MSYLLYVLVDWKKKYCLKKTVNCGNNLVDWLLNLQKNPTYYIHYCWRNVNKNHGSHIGQDFFQHFQWISYEEDC